MSDNILKHNDFFGSVEYSATDECFFGKIIGLSDLVTFEGDSVKALKEAFIEAVDDYLIMCEQLGKDPQKTYKGSFNVRISPELHREAAVKASLSGLSLNALVEKAIYNELHSN